MSERDVKERGVIRETVGLMGVAVAGCVVKTCQFIFDKPKKYKGGFKLEPQ